MPGHSIPCHGDEASVLLEPELQEPPRFAVYLHNDNYTTKDFVVLVLREIFYKTEGEAFAIMEEVHNQGMAKCGSYIKEVAATKTRLVHERATEAGFPLLCSMEQE